MEVSSQIGPFSIVPEWVLYRGLSPTALKLYIVMARFADWNTGMAFPSRDTLAQRMDCSLKTIDRAVSELVQAECVAKISRGRYASALYKVFQTDPRGTKTSYEWTEMTIEETDLSSEGTNLSEREDKNDHLTITTELEPLNREPLNDIGQESPFDEWWSYYPRKEGKGAARKEFAKAIKKVSLDELINAADNYRNDPNREPKFTVQPARWLREERWEDGPLPMNRPLTNSERNLLNFANKINTQQKEVENGQEPSASIASFGLNLRSADSV